MYASAPSSQEGCNLLYQKLHTPIPVVSSKHFKKLRKRRWCNAGLVIIIDDAAGPNNSTQLQRCQLQDGSRSSASCDCNLCKHFENLPSGVYEKWSAWDKKHNRKNLSWDLRELSAATQLDDLWRSRFDRKSEQHVGYPFCFSLVLLHVHFLLIWAERTHGALRHLDAWSCINSI